MASSGSSSVRSSCQTGSSTPWPAVRRMRARSRGSCASRPGRCSSTSDSGWSANSGWRSQSETMSSIGIASIHEASFSSASARCTRSGPSSMPAVAPTSTNASSSSGARSAALRASLPPREYPAGTRGQDLADPRLERVLGVVEEPARIAFRQELRDRPPGVATLHEARDEEHHRSPMIPINHTYAPLQAFVEELYRCGVRHAVTSPGSRNAPIALTLAAQDGVEAVSVLDERSAGFAALGMAKASGRPVAITCTSGTAAANLHPAVVEAFEARIPLVVLTADRPPELREIGAGQSIDQLRLYGSAAKWFVEVGTHEPGRETAIHHRALACRAYWTAAGGRPGPVHLNFPLREPLAPAPEQLEAADWEGREDWRPWTEVRAHASAPHADDVH